MTALPEGQNQEPGSGAKDISAAPNPQPDGDELLPVLYQELRRLARSRLARERPGQTLQATALVHEAWLRLAGDGDGMWNSKAHFFGAAALAMRRILVEKARQKSRLRHGGEYRQIDLEHLDQTTRGAVPARHEEILAVDQALERLEEKDARKRRLVELRFFAGLTVPECAEVLGVSVGTVERDWRFLRAWLREQFESGAIPSSQAEGEQVDGR